MLEKKPPDVNLGGQPYRYGTLSVSFHANRDFGRNSQRDGVIIERQHLKASPVMGSRCIMEHRRLPHLAEVLVDLLLVQIRFS
jgi:hypothetical protein